LDPPVVRRHPATHCRQPALGGAWDDGGESARTRLEHSGFAQRLRNPADRRGILVRATPAGRKIFARLTPRLREYHHSQWSNLSRHELETLNGLLGRALWGSKLGDRPAILAAIADEAT
jgi:hypothetical protein